MAPLISSSDSCVVVIDPLRRHLGKLDPTLRHQLEHSFLRISAAAATASVPCHFLIQDEAARHADWLAVCPKDQNIHTIGQDGSSWSNSQMGQALLAQGKASLLICGFWLETKVTFTALSALTCGFDVFVLLDAAPSSTVLTREPSSARLVQAGVVPTTTQQVLAEWAEDATDQEVRTNLSALLHPM